MHRLLWVSSILLGVLLLTGCESQSLSKLKSKIRMTAAECPVNTSETGTLKSISYSDADKAVVAEWEINDELTNIEALNKDTAILSQQTKLLLQSKAFDEMQNDMVKSDAGLDVTFVDVLSGGQKASFKFTPEQVKMLRDEPYISKDAQNKILLENYVQVQNQKCPYAETNGLEITTVGLTDKGIEYVCDVDAAALKRIEYDNTEKKNIIMKDLLTQLKENGISQRRVLALWDMNMGITYRFVCGDKGVNIDFTPGELHMYLPKYLR